MNRGIGIGTTVFAIWVTVVSGNAHSQSGEPRRIDSRGALELAAAHSPRLAAAMLGRERAGAQVEAEQGLYPFVLQLDGGYDHSASPSLSGDGGVTTRKSDTVAVGGELRKSFTTGTSASLRVDGDRQTFEGPSAVPGVEQTTGPAYGLSAKLSVTQPLLRGAGKRVGEASLRQARIGSDMAQHTRDRVASELALDVLSTYWSLWYADRALGIETAARDLAKDQLDEMEARAREGEAAPVDTLPFRTRLASLEEAVVAAELERMRLGIEMNRLIGIPDEGPPLLPDEREEPPIPGLSGDVRGAIGTALERSPEVQELTSQVALAEEQSRIAGEEMRPGLDLTGYLQARVLGNQEIGPAFEQLAGDAYSAYIGIIYELPLDDTRKSAQLASAAINVKIAHQDLWSARDQITAQVRTAFDRLVSSRKILELAEQTAKVAEEQAASERERFDLGAAVYLQVKEAEEEARQAKLRFTQARTDAAKAGLELAHLTGELLDQPVLQRAVR